MSPVSLPSLSGRNCLYQEIVHNQKTCREFIITQPKPNSIVFILSMLVLNGIGYQIELYAQDQTLLSAVVLLLLVLLIININVKVQQESLLVMSSVGVQYTIQFVSGRRKAEFIAENQLRDIIINEAITMHRVIFYLAILVGDHQRITAIKPVFMESMPRLEGLVKIYRGIQAVMNQSASRIATT